MRIYALLILLLCGVTSISQNCENTLSGTVTDLHDNSTLFGAVLIVAGTEQVVETDMDGKFTIPNLCDESYSIQVSHPACATQGFTINIDGNTVKNFKLEHHLEELNQITIEGKAYGKKSNSIQESTLATSDLERFNSGSVGDVLNSLSGVSSLNTGNTVIKPLINGLHSSRVVIMNNGVRMQDQEWGAEHAPNLDINAIGNLTLIKGASALQYSGNAVGGIIIAEAMKVPVKDSIYGKTLLTGASNGRGASLSSQLTKSYQNGWYATVQGTLKKFGDFEAPDYIMSNTGIFERNASLNFGYNKFDYGFEGYYSFFKNEIGILSASHLGGAEDQIRAINSNVPLIIDDFTYTIDAPKQNVTHHLVKLKGFKRLEGFGKLSVQYDYQKNKRLEYDIRRGEDRNKASLDLELDTHTVLIDLASKLSENASLKTGLMGSYQKNYAANTGIRRLIPDYKKYDFGIYALSHVNVNDNWLVEGGLRYDYSNIDAYKFYRTSFWEARNYDELFPNIVVEEYDNQILTNPKLKFNNLSATIGTTYTFNDNFKVFLNYALASRAPNPSEFFSEGLHHSASRIELGDLRFKSEVGHKVSLTLSHNNHKNFSFSVNPFLNSITNFKVIEPTEVQQTIRGNFQVWEYRQTSAQLVGVDVDASYDFTDKLTFNHQFSLVKGYDKTRDEPLINMPPVNTTNEIVYQNKKIKNLQLALTSEYHFRQNEYPNNNFEVFIPTTQTNELIDVSTPPNAYHLLNFRSSIDFRLKNDSKLRLGFAVNNLLDTTYRNYLNRLRFYSDDLGRNFLLNIKINY